MDLLWMFGGSVVDEPRVCLGGEKGCRDGVGQALKSV